MDSEKERHCKSKKGRERTMAVKERENDTGRGGGFFLVAITIQSGRNVCGTKWSVMGNRLLQLHIEGERRQQRGHRRTGRQRALKARDVPMLRFLPDTDT